MEKFTTTALALSFTKQEEIGAVQSTVAWAMAALDLRLGWTAPVKPGMDGKTAIKVLRETHGYRTDAEGKPVLDKKGNRAKRSAVYSRLALVEKLVSHMAKTAPAFVTEMHLAALAGDIDRMSETVTAIGASYCAMSGDDTLDALGYFLDHGKAKPAKETAPIADPIAELAKDAAKDATKDAATVDMVDSKGDTRPATFGDVLAWLTLHKMDMTPAQWESVLEMGTAEMLQRSVIAAQDEADKIAA